MLLIVSSSVPAKVATNHIEGGLDRQIPDEHPVARKEETTSLALVFSRHPDEDEPDRLGLAATGGTGNSRNPNPDVSTCTSPDATSHCFGDFITHGAESLN
jgi:hypothetical protein